MYLQAPMIIGRERFSETLKILQIDSIKHKKLLPRTNLIYKRILNIELIRNVVYRINKRCTLCGSNKQGDLCYGCPVHPLVCNNINGSINPSLIQKSRVSSRVAVSQLVFTLEQKAPEQKALEQKALEQISKLQSKILF